MKRLILTILLVAALTAFFTSCSKDESLDGQTWGSESFTGQLVPPNYKCVITLNFTESQVNATINWKEADDDDDTGESCTAKGTYTYDKKEVKIKVVNDIEAIDETWSGKVDKKTMTLDVVMHVWGVGEQVKFTKQ